MDALYNVYLKVNICRGFVMFKVDTVLYPPKVLVFTSAEEYNQWEDKRGLDRTDLRFCDGHTSLVEYQKTGKHYFRMYLDPKTDLFTVSHECIHMCWYILDYCGVQIDSDNHEALTYLHDYLFKKIVIKLSK